MTTSQPGITVVCFACKRTIGTPSAGEVFKCPFCGAALDTSRQLVLPPQMTAYDTPRQPYLWNQRPVLPLFYYRWSDQRAWGKLIVLVLATLFILLVFAPAALAYREMVPVLGLLLSLGLHGSYRALARALNVSLVGLEIEDDKVFVVSRHGPLPWRGGRVFVGDIGHFGAENYSIYGKRGLIKTLDLVIYRKDGRRVVLIPDLKRPRAVIGAMVKDLITRLNPSKVTDWAYKDHLRRQVFTY